MLLRAWHASFCCCVVIYRLRNQRKCMANAILFRDGSCRCPLFGRRSRVWYVYGIDYWYRYVRDVRGVRRTVQCASTHERLSERAIIYDDNQMTIITMYFMWLSFALARLWMRRVAMLCRRRMYAIVEWPAAMRSRHHTTSFAHSRFVPSVRNRWFFWVVRKGLASPAGCEPGGKA